jgi:hypothetical protein
MTNLVTNDNQLFIVLKWLVVKNKFCCKLPTCFYLVTLRHTVVHMENQLWSFVTHVLHENMLFILLECIKAVLNTIPQGMH